MKFSLAYTRTSAFFPLPVFLVFHKRRPEGEKPALKRPIFVD
jgi:hypothetical protein